MVASPRNQRYLHPRSFFGAGVSVCEVDEAGKLAIKLDSELPVVRHQPNLFDQVPEARGGLQARQLVVEGFGKVDDLLLVGWDPKRVFYSWTRPIPSGESRGCGVVKAPNGRRRRVPEAGRCRPFQDKASPRSVAAKGSG